MATFRPLIFLLLWLKWRSITLLIMVHRFLFSCWNRQREQMNEVRRWKTRRFNRCWREKSNSFHIGQCASFNQIFLSNCSTNQTFLVFDNFTQRRNVSLRNCSPDKRQIFLCSNKIGKILIWQHSTTRKKHQIKALLFLNFRLSISFWTNIISSLKAQSLFNRDEHFLITKQRQSSCHSKIVNRRSPSWKQRNLALRNRCFSQTIWWKCQCFT